MPNHDSRILVTGSAGFIGYHLAIKCLKLKWKVTSISLKKPRKKRKLKNVIYKLCDISLKKKLHYILKNQEYNYLNIPKEIVEKLKLEDEYVTIKVTGNTMIITKIGETITMPQVENGINPDDILI